MAPCSTALHATIGSFVLGSLPRCADHTARSQGGPPLRCPACKNVMTEADPIEPVSDEEPVAPVIAELARIRTEVRQIAQQVQALATEMDRIRCLLPAGYVRSSTSGRDQGAIYVIREQQMTQFLCSMAHALQTFLQQRAATPLP